MQLPSILAALVLTMMTASPQSAPVAGISSASEFHVREGGIATADVDAAVATRMVPEPENYALMLAGLCAMGALIRRRSRRG